MKSSEAGSPSVLVIGFDALDYQIFREHTSNELHVYSLQPETPVTGPSWTTIYTGMGRRKHRVEDMWGRALSGLRIGNGTLLVHLKQALLRKKDWRDITVRTYATCLVPYIWDYLSREGIEVGLYNLPVTYPPRKVKGFQVSGFPLPPSGVYTYPRKLQRSLPEEYFEMSDMVHWYSNPLKDEVHIWKKPLADVSFDEVLERVRSQSFSMAESFVEINGGRDFLMIQFSFLDRIGHVYGVDETTSQALYGLVDDLITFLQESMRPSNLFVVSDHGLRERTHTDEGVFAFRGDDLVEGRLQKIDTRDIAPTLLCLFGIGSSSMEGNIQYGILRRELSTPQISASKRIIREAIDRFFPNLGVVCDFSVRDVSVLFLVKETRGRMDLPVLFADTGLYSDEVYELKSEVSNQLGLDIIEVTNKQLYGTRQDDLEACCRDIRLAPLQKKMGELGIQAYLGGRVMQREGQSGRTATLELLGLTRIEPLRNWSDEEVWAFTRDRNIPYNPLYDKGYANIVCGDCTVLSKEYLARRAKREDETEKIIENLKRLGYW